ncbi:FapA family protein [Marinitoga sp. 38H-ov]|uniref:DUF342 domain-containing protein n=1 Tax=Marinitoga sp. 38H-ov TaxID=1755814 RepID=UPI0013ED90D2|nr:FapA family protein [Marinitoga sp. 38H-ov]KAF2955900.1 hypothetical protein AS160_08445 [Marinitoga sp. 38H-ov]
MAIIKIHTSEDYKKAYISLLYDGRISTENELYNALKNANIKVGIKYDVLKSLVVNPIYNQSILIAEAIPPSKGDPGYVEIYKNLDIEKKEINYNEKIDFREFAKNIITVELGEKIGFIHPPTIGKPGKDILGKEIPGLLGDPAKVILEKNVEKDDEGYIIAASSGELKIRKDIDGTLYISIEPIYEINGDVDFNTGNINFPGKVIIRGSVKPGFIVEAEEDIEIYGEIEAATVISQKNLKVNGIKGSHKGIIKAQNIYAKFAENANLEAKEKILIDKSLINCNVIYAEELILDGYNSKIVGGNINVLKKVESHYIGSTLGVLTTIEVGVDPKLYTEYSNLLELTKKYTEELKAITPQITSLMEKLKQSKLKVEKANYLKKILNRTKILKNEIENSKTKLIELKKLINNSKKEGVVIARKMLYPGVQIKIQNKLFNTENAISSVQIMNIEDEIKLFAYVNEK